MVPLKFPFSLVECVAVKFDMLQVSATIPTCQNRQCGYGQCIEYHNDPKNTSFYRCQTGWTGQYCNISYNCICSSNSLCVGIAANGRSICVCPLGKFGSQYLLDSNMLQVQSNDQCYNQGIPLPADEHTMLEQSSYCLCSEGFYGDQCGISDMKIILSLHNDLILSSPFFASLRFIYFNNDTTSIDDNSWKQICPDDTSIISN